LLRSVSFITTVSEFLKDKIALINATKPIFILPNGFDDEIIEQIKHIKQNEKILSIGFAGTIYDWNPLEIFLKNLFETINENPSIQVMFNFYGTNRNNWLNDYISNRYPILEKYINVFPKMPNVEIVEKLASNNLLLLFNYYSFMGTKIYEYLGLERKILFCYSDDEEAMNLKKEKYQIDEAGNNNTRMQEDLLRELDAGIIVSDQKHFKSIIGNLCKQFMTQKYIECPSGNIAKYSRKMQVMKLAEIINAIPKGNINKQ
jgi:hypothetical protein